MSTANKRPRLPCVVWEGELHGKFCRLVAHRGQNGGVDFTAEQRETDRLGNASYREAEDVEQDLLRIALAKHTGLGTFKP